MTIVRPHLTEVEVQAVRAVIGGVASGDQQKLASDWLLREAARVTDLAFVEGEDGRRDTDFALGRQYAGHLWRQMLHPATLIKAKGQDEARRAASKRVNPDNVNQEAPPL